jgi:long-chain acyl-CoA synthetase
MSTIAERTLFSLLEEAAGQWPALPALHQPRPGETAPKYAVYTWADFRDAAREIAAGLRQIGIRKGDVVGLMSETRAEFYLADFGIMGSGAISAALYTSYPMPDLVGTLRAANARLVFVEHPKYLKGLRDAGGDQLGARWVLMTGETPGAMTLDELRKLGREAMAADAQYWPRLQEELTPQQHAILYLTSGATGEPKMGLVTHGALLANAETAPHVLPLTQKDVILAFLPSAHIAQRIGIELVAIRLGVPTWFSEGLSKLPHELQSVRPTFFLAPPRVWERVYASICTEIRKRNAATRRIFWAALGLGLRAGKYRQQGKALPRLLSAALKPADKLVFSKLRERFGGSLKIPVSGAAPLGKDLAAFYEAIGMPLIEGYGLTEGGVTTLNPVDRPRSGSIGKMLPTIEAKINEDGELILGGPTIFAGYYNDPETTAQVLRDGWLYTGDLAEMDAEGYFFITGRKKEMIVSSNGKKIYPSRVENLFKMEPLVSQMILIGDRKPYVSALFTVNVANAETLKGMEEFRGRAPAEIATAPPVLSEMKKAVTRANRQLAPFEQIRKFRVLDSDFSIDKGELTATMKVRRAKVLENYRAVVSELYSGKDEGE